MARTRLGIVVARLYFTEVPMETTTMSKIGKYLMFFVLCLAAVGVLQYSSAQDPHDSQPASCHNNMAKGDTPEAAYCDKCKSNCKDKGESTACKKYCKKDDCHCVGGCTS